MEDIDMKPAKMKMRIVFIHSTNPYVDYDSITNYIRGIMKVFGDKCSFYGRSDHRMIPISGPENFEFVPLLFRHANPFMPATLGYQYHMLANRHLINGNDSVLSVHQVEWAVPLLYPKKIGPTVLTIHGASKFLRIATKNRAKIIHHEMSDRLAIKRADRVILVSRDAYDFYCNRYPKIRRKFIFVPTFVDQGLFRPLPNRAALRQERGLKRDDIVIMYVGRFVPEKGLSLLLRCFEELASSYQKIKLILVGDGLLRKSIQDMIRNGTGNVEIWEPCGHPDMPLVFNCADLLVLPSRFEATPLAVLEALACGVPVVASKVGDLPKIIIDGVNGYLVKEQTESAFVRAIEHAIAGLEKLSSEQCINSVKPYFISNVVPQILDVYLQAWQETQKMV